MARGNFTNHPKGVDSPLWKGGSIEKHKRYNQKESSKLKRQVYNKLWYQNHKSQWRFYHQKARIKLKTEVLSYYGHGILACVHCGFNDLDCLSIDHINGGGNQHAKEVGRGMHMWYWLRNNDYPDGYQTLCMNCQFKKRAKTREEQN